MKYESQNFNGFEEFQMWKYGNILPEIRTNPVMIELADEPEIDEDA